MAAEIGRWLGWGCFVVAGLVILVVIYASEQSSQAAEAERAEAEQMRTEARGYLDEARELLAAKPQPAPRVDIYLRPVALPGKGWRLEGSEYVLRPKAYRIK